MEGCIYSVPCLPHIVHFLDVNLPSLVIMQLAHHHPWTCYIPMHCNATLHSAEARLY